MRPATRAGPPGVTSISSALRMPTLSLAVNVTASSPPRDAPSSRPPAPSRTAGRLLSVTTTRAPNSTVCTLASLRREQAVVQQPTLTLSESASGWPTRRPKVAFVTSPAPVSSAPLG